MVISHLHRYVFVEVPRTGSSAIATELRENYAGELILRKHATYRDFLRQATDDEKTYFVFSGIRNPLDVAVTRYVHLKSDARGHFSDPHHVGLRNSMASRIERRIFAWMQRTGASFEAFLRRWYLLPYDTWTSLDHRDMDFIIHFESLADDFAEVLRRIGVEPVRPLPAKNTTPGRERDFVSYYTPGADSPCHVGVRSVHGRVGLPLPQGVGDRAGAAVEHGVDAHRPHLPRRLLEVPPLR